MRFSNFIDWCLNKETLSSEARYTVEVLLEQAYTYECEDANRSLASRTNLWIFDERISDLTPLQSLTHLTQLDLSRSQVTDLAPLQYLTNLTTLSLGSDRIIDLSPLQHLTQLTTLSLRGARITDLSPLKSLTHLTKFELSNTQTSNLTPLRSLTHLKELILVNNQITDLSPLQFLTHLTNLCIFNYHGNGVVDINPLHTLNHLRKLDLSHNQITDLKPLQLLTNLIELNLSHNQITDLTPLQFLTQLTTLSLYGNQITDLTPLSSLTHLNVLYLGTNQITDLSPLQSLTHLTFLDICDNPVTNVSPLKSLTHLTFKTLEEQPIDITLKNWIRYIFAHPVTEPAWYWNSNETWLYNIPPAVTVAYLAQLFENSRKVLQPFCEAQLNQGLWYLISNSCSDQIFALFDESVPWSDRQRCIHSIYTFFEQCFAKRCSPYLSHTDESNTNPLNSVCYMWWDILPWHGHPEQPNHREMDAEFINVMQRILALDSDAVVESALHGLGHWYVSYPVKVEAIIDEFLARRPNLRPELREYALHARIGYVQ